MANETLFANVTGSVTGYEGDSTPATIGVRFQVTASGWYLKGIRWYCQAPSYGVAAAVGVWDHNQIQLWPGTQPTLPTTPSTGWRTVIIDSPIALTANQTYTVAFEFGGLIAAGKWAIGSYAAPNSPLVWDDNRYYKTNSYSLVFPTTGSASQLVGVDCIVGDDNTTLIPGGTGQPDVATMEQYFSTDSGINTKQDRIPWLDHAILTSDTYGLAVLKTAVDAIKAKTDALPGSVSTPILAVLDQLVTDAETAAADRAQMLARLDSAGGGSGFGTVVDDVLGPLAPVIAAYSMPAPATWVSQGTQAFDTSLAWTQEADAYTITFTDLGSAIVSHTIGSQDVAYRLAWWAISDGERMRERRFVDAPLAVVWDEGRRMPGLVLHSPAGASGTVEAWVLQ